MSDIPTVQPARPEQPTAPEPGTRPALAAVQVLAVVCQLFAFVSLALWGFLAWPTPWNFVVGIGAPVIAILLSALFVSPRAVLRIHPFVRAFVELLIYASGTMAWWAMDAPWVGLIYGVIAVTVGLFAGLRRFS